MSVPVKLVAFLATLVLVFGGGWALGAAVGPLDSPTTAPPTTAPTQPSHVSDDHRGGG